MLGEQAILNKEIYVRGDANDSLVFVNTEVFMELINSREKREVAKIIFDAVASRDIAYSTKDYGKVRR